MKHDYLPSRHHAAALKCGPFPSTVLELSQHEVVQDSCAVSWIGQLHTTCSSLWKVVLVKLVGFQYILNIYYIEYSDGKLHP